MTRFDAVEEGEQYQSTTTPDREVLEVLVKRSDEIIFEAIDDGYALGRYSRSDWDPARWVLADNMASSG